MSLMRTLAVLAVTGFVGFGVPACEDTDYVDERGNEVEVDRDLGETEIERETPSGEVETEIKD